MAKPYFQIKYFFNFLVFIQNVGARNEICEQPCCFDSFVNEEWEGEGERSTDRNSNHQNSNDQNSADQN